MKTLLSLLKRVVFVLLALVGLVTILITLAPISCYAPMGMPPASEAPPASPPASAPPASPGTREPTDAAGGIVARDGEHHVVSMFWATDRQRTDYVDPNLMFGPERSSRLALGTATVSIPARHEKGTVERPRFWRLEFSENADKHVVVKGLEEIGDDVYPRLAKLASEERAAILVFIHGFNVEFAEALRRTAQLAYDLQPFKAVPVAYSWFLSREHVSIRRRQGGCAGDQTASRRIS